MNPCSVRVVSHCPSSCRDRWRISHCVPEGCKPPGVAGNLSGHYPLLGANCRQGGSPQRLFGIGFCPKRCAYFRSHTVGYIYISDSLHGSLGSRLNSLLGNHLAQSVSTHGFLLSIVWSSLALILITYYFQDIVCGYFHIIMACYPTGSGGGGARTVPTPSPS